MTICRVFLSFLFFLTASANAQGFPEKPVRVVVPFPPGGGADALARLMTPKLTEIWKQQVIVENKPGASGHIGADLVAQSAPDGYTLLMSSTASLTEKNVHQFAPVTLVSASPYVLTLSSKTNLSNVKELISYAKNNPGKLTFGSSGTGAASHLSAELFKSMAKIDLLHVPYKGTGQALTDLLAGQIDVMFAPSQTVMPHVKAGKLKALATTGAARSENLPELPTVAESGLPGYQAVGWFGVLAPAATPPSLVLKLNKDLVSVLGDRDLRKRAADLGADIVGDKPDEFARFIRDDQGKWSKLMREAGIKPE
jgi:tripartite-type tricarboxylate transporter receptor subunit TctC